MVKVKEIKNELFKIYSDINLMILDKQTKQIHSEYVVYGEPDLSRYEEISKVNA